MVIGYRNIINSIFYTNKPSKFKVKLLGNWKIFLNASKSLKTSSYK